MFTINIDYQDGDSNGHSQYNSNVPGKWTLDIAKENLKRIKEHYKLVNNINGFVSCGLGTHEEAAKSEYENARWRCHDGDISQRTGKPIMRCDDMYIRLLENDGTELAYYIFWHSWAASLDQAIIVAAEDEPNIDNDMVFRP